jgi:hypothetical protein
MGPQMEDVMLYTFILAGGQIVTAKDKDDVSYIVGN